MSVPFTETVAATHFTPAHGRAHHERTILPERNLDILRAIAVMLVVLDHLMQTMGDHGHFAFWSGQAGVSAFFVHTSLVLMASLERDGAPLRKGWIRRFYIRRSFRIYPLAWVAIAIVCLLQIPATITATWQPVSLATLLTNLLLVQDLALHDSVLPVLWTLPIEMQMYAMLPFCYLMARRPSWRPWLVMFVVACALGIISTYGIRPQHLIRGLNRIPLLRFIPCFLMGVYAYRMLRTRTAGAVLPWWSWPLIISANVAAGTYTFFVMPNWLSRAIFCAILGFCIPLLQDAPKSWFTTVANKLATYSYGIYLLHQLAIHVAFGTFADQSIVVKLVITFASLTVMCLAAYHLVEKPCIELGRKLLHDRGKVSLEATAPPP